MARPDPSGGPGGLGARLGITPSTAALLAAILLIGAGQEVAKPFMPRFINDQPPPEWLRSLAGAWWARYLPILLVGLYGSVLDLMEAVYYRTGGGISARLGMRRSLLLFNLLPIAGAVLVGGIGTPVAAILAIPLLQAWDSISMPATLTVVGEALPVERRTLAFSLQAIQRRIPRIFGYLAGGVVVGSLGAVAGVRWAMGGFVLLALAAFLVQRRHLHVQAPDAGGGGGLGLAGFPVPLKRLLVSDILVRWCEGLPRELFVLLAIGGAAGIPGGAVRHVGTVEFGALRAEEALLQLALYLPLGFAASRAGYGKKPYIGLTFLFFTAFPLAFVLLGPSMGLAGYAIAYAVGGLREVGEPARKAMITELVPAEHRTRAIGLYWSVRSLAVMAAPLAGALLWIALGPAAPFLFASACGLAGTLYFYGRFGRQPELNEHPLQ